MSQTIKTWFNARSPEQKRKIVVGGAVAVIMTGVVIGVLATDDGPKPMAQGPKKKVETSILTGRDPQRVGNEQLTAGIRRNDADIENLKRQLQVLANQQNQANGVRPAQTGSTLPYPYGNQGGQEVVALPGTVPTPGQGVVSGGAGTVNSPAVPAVRAPDQAVDKAMAGMPGMPGVGQVQPGQRGPAGLPGVGGPPGMALPPPNIPGIPKDNSDVFGGAPGAGASDNPAAAPPPPKLKLRVLTPRQDSAAAGDAPSGPSLASAGAKNPLGGLMRTSQREPEFYLPMGAIMSGTLMTGIDAPASGAAAKKDPFPALFRIKKDIILPNSGLLDLKECFIVASAYGELSSERVYMRAEGLSCQRGDGAIIEASIDAYASGSDGKAGVRGEVVEKTGQLISRSLLAGFVGGLGKAFKPQQAQQVNVNGGSGQAAFQYPAPDFVIGSGLLGGGASAAERISGIYEDLAHQIVPVISVNAGIPIDFIVTRGTTLRFKRVGETAASNLVAQSSGSGKPKASAEGVMTSITNALGGGFSVTPGEGSSQPAMNPGGPSTTLTSRKGGG